MPKKQRKTSPSRPKKTARLASPPVYYPVSLDLDARHCVVVGGGRVAERKARSLVEAGAQVRVVSPALTPGLQRLKAAHAITHSARRFRATDVRAAFLVIAATDSEAGNARVRLACQGHCLLNVVDQPELSNFIVPATLKRGPLSISVSTSGASPAMARAIKDELAALYGPAFGRYLRRLYSLRPGAIERFATQTARARFFKSLATPRVIKMLRGGKLPSGKTGA